MTLARVREAGGASTLALLIGLGTGLGGCYPLWSGNRLEDRLLAVENASREQGEGQEQLRRDFDGRFQERLQKIDETVESLNRAAHRTTAEVGAQVDDILKQLALLRGEIADLRFRDEDVATRIGEIERKVVALGGDRALERHEAKKALAEVERPADRKQFFQLARGYHDRKEYSYSRPLFAEYIEKWKYDDMSPQAQLLVGDSYFDEKQFRAAILEYQKVRETWPKSRQVPDALLKLGLSFLELNMRDEARVFLEEAAKFSGQDAGKAARAKLKELASGKKK